MKIALISPKANFLTKSNIFHEFWSSADSTLGYRQKWSGLSTALLVIAALTPPDIEVEIIDENIEPIHFSDQYDLVGITALTQQATRAYQIAEGFRRLGVKTAIGGIHATVLPEEAKAHADSIIIGEAEYLWPEFIRDYKNNCLKPFYNTSQKVDLKDSPIPRYDLIKNKHYKTLWMQTTRGCPHDCEFCAASTIYGHSYRTKSVNQVVKEIESIIENFGNIRINFGDDNLFINKKYAREMLAEINSLRIHWGTQSDISIADDPEMLQLIKKSGCNLLFIGLESLSEESLKQIDKQQWKSRQLKNYPKSIQQIQNQGISVMGAFILGLDNDDSKVFQRTSDFIIENVLGDAQISILTPLPGTRLRTRLENENRLLPTSWDNYTFFDVNFIHPKLSKEELEQGLLDIYQSINTEEFYLKKMNHFKEIHKSLLRQEEGSV